MLSYLRVFFEKTYELFDSVNVPGFNISIMTVLLGAFGALVSISLLKMIFGLGNSAVSGGFSTLAGMRVSQRGGNNEKIKISKERSKDKK